MSMTVKKKKYIGPNPPQDPYEWVAIYENEDELDVLDKNAKVKKEKEKEKEKDE